ncbi:MAG: class I adenylate-forming enzyme family protein [Actinomycetota bacterium]|nr:class I adenylate-forming enzyme family protein [Actinomycetota bacterium]
MSHSGTPYGIRLSNLAEERGSASALLFAESEGPVTEWSWSELESRSNQAARLLRGRDVRTGDIVVVGLANSPDHVVAVFGAWKLGASVLPLRSDLPEWERDRLLQVAGHTAVVADWVSEEFRAVTSRDLEEAVELDPSPVPDGGTPRYSRLIATSGSTGTPKIILGSDPALYTDQGDTTGNVSAEAGVVLCASPLYHTNGAASCFNPLLAGSRVVLMEKFDAPRFVELVERHKVNGTILVPTMLQRIARLDGIRSRNLSSLDFVHYGGASLPEWVARTWLELVPPENFIFSYGGSEGLGLTMCTGREWLDHPGTSGRPVGCEVVIVAGDGEVLPVGETGQIYMRRTAPGATFQYVGVPTPEPIMGGYLSFGDLGRLDEDGYLYIADRRQDMIVTGGVNVFPAEVEAALSEHPEVADVVVIGIPDPAWGHRVHAIVEPREATDPPDVETLRDFAKKMLAGPKVPKSFEFLDQLPRTTAGKINRARLIEARIPEAGSAQLP